ncbi:hypothetical protein [Flectobacillus longus]|uniref:hypothetical protein n=1 Tax=Flectobacillus longus TaxID=2984207 RepID=UPI0024B86A2A|nr:hypothetical protein [Flectobacillus longus]MDI9877815.1 hypothetical protein [Flectobacillus longus]
MKKVSIILFVFLFGIVMKGFSQSTKPTDFWAGKWEFTVMGTPEGDSKFTTDLIRKEGKLTGDLSSPTMPSGEKIAITKIEESAEKIVIYFSAKGFDINLEFNKVDDNNLKGSMMSMFDAKGIRIKE